jgi:hypothetical protein
MAYATSSTSPGRRIGIKRIIDQHIELAEMPGGGGHDSGPAFLVGDIERLEPRRGAVCPG